MLRPAVIEDAVSLPGCAPLEAFAWVADPDRLPSWMGGLVGLRWVGPPPEAVGRSFTLERTWGRLRQPHPAVVTAWEPGRRLGWEILQDQLTVRRDTTIEATAEGARLRVRLELQPVTVLARLALPAFRREAARRLRAELAALAQVVARG